MLNFSTRVLYSFLAKKSKSNASTNAVICVLWLRGCQNHAIAYTKKLFDELRFRRDLTALKILGLCDSMMDSELRTICIWWSEEKTLTWKMCDRVSAGSMPTRRAIRSVFSLEKVFSVSKNAHALPNPPLFRGSCTETATEWERQVLPDLNAPKTSVMRPVLTPPPRILSNSEESVVMCW